jgi:hypothetical protein
MQAAKKRHLVGQLMRYLLRSALIAAALLLASPAFADDWTVVKLRGTVQQFVEDAWVALARGDIVPDARTIRTLDDGHADLVRGKEALTLAPNTQITIHDKPGDIPYTTINQDSGSLEVEAEKLNVQHFAVETQFLAAVVKGTHFTVTADGDSSAVKVNRGHVAVQSIATGRTTLVGVDQEARVTTGADLVVAGIGDLPPVLEPDGTVLRPGFSVKPAALTQGQTNLAALPQAGAAQPNNAEVQTAMLITPGNARQVIDMTALAAGNNNGVVGDSGVMAAPAEVPPVNGITILVGLLIGAMIGAIALLFRRSVG